MTVVKGPPTTGIPRQRPAPPRVVVCSEVIEGEVGLARPPVLKEPDPWSEGRRRWGGGRWGVGDTAVHNGCEVVVPIVVGVALVAALGVAPAASAGEYRVDIRSSDMQGWTWVGLAPRGDS